MSDPYVDPATGVLRNRMAISDADQLARAEAHLAFHAEIRLHAAGTTFRRYDLPATGVLLALHQQPEEDHRGGEGEGAHQRGEVGDPCEPGDEHNHDGGTDRVLDPAHVVPVVVDEPLVRPVHAGGSDEQVVGGSEEEEQRHRRANGE